MKAGDVVSVAIVTLLLGFSAGIGVTIYTQPRSLFHENLVILWNGLGIVIEHPRHSVRLGIDKKGIQWYKKMVHHYGHLHNHDGRDGEKTDVYVGPFLNSKKVFVVTQNDQYGKFDEYKVMIGFQNIEQAKEGYLVHYPDDWKGFGGIKEFDLQTFLDWLC